MKIYTRVGDDGKTSLFNGDRVDKNECHVEAYGAVDELNSALGLAGSHIQEYLTKLAQPHESQDEMALRIAKMEHVKRQVHVIQNSLFDLGAHLATPLTTSSKEAIARTSFRTDVSGMLEEWMDAMDTELPPLRTFVLPGGHVIASALHIARTICRRAERQMVPLLNAGDMAPHAFMFVNRLSDYLFVLSRYINVITECEENRWVKNLGVEANTGSNGCG